MACTGNGPDHCCWFHGEVCQYLEENTIPNRRWVCGLMREMGDWETVVASNKYQTNIIPLYEKWVWKEHTLVKHGCDTWPSEGCDCDC